MIKSAELDLMTAPARHNHSRVQALLHDDFVEIGRSGHRWTRDEIVASLAEERDPSVPDLDEWAFVSLSPVLMLVTYRTRDAGGESRHSSIWDVHGEAPQMRFHQGTVVPSVAAAR